MPDQDCLFIRLGSYFADRRTIHQDAISAAAEEQHASDAEEQWRGGGPPDLTGGRPTRVRHRPLMQD